MILVTPHAGRFADLLPYLNQLQFEKRLTFVPIWHHSSEQRLPLGPMVRMGAMGEFVSDDIVDEARRGAY